MSEEQQHHDVTIEFDGEEGADAGIVEAVHSVGEYQQNKGVANLSRRQIRCSGGAHTPTRTSRS